MINVTNGYLAAAHAKRRELEFQNQAEGGNPFHAQHIIQFCDYADNLVAGAMEELRASLPQMIAEVVNSPRVQVEVDEKSYKTAKQKIEDLFNMIFKR